MPDDDGTEIARLPSIGLCGPDQIGRACQAVCPGCPVDTLTHIHRHGDIDWHDILVKEVKIHVHQHEQTATGRRGLGHLTVFFQLT